MNYYNDNDPHSAARLRSLISAGLIPPGDVDDRSICDVRPSDLSGFTQCHFFAGIGGWSHALQLAGISAETKLWTGSCPCQPFSAAGKRKGTADERHLWPIFRDLIAQCKPPIVFGEQVASADGRGWLSSVRSEMEELGYAVGAADLCAAGIGAPHIRQRLYFVGMANADDQRLQGRAGMPERSDKCAFGEGGVGGRLADSDNERLEGAERQGLCRHVYGYPELGEIINPDAIDGFWKNADWLYCRDGKWRPVEPRTFPLAHGVPGRVGLLRGYGNAIVPQVAATFIRAALT